MMMFWNVTWLKNKDRSFWMGLKGWDEIMMSETWVEERDWKKIKKGLPEGFEWGVQWASRKSRRGKKYRGNVNGNKKDDNGEEDKN